MNNLFCTKNILTGILIVLLIILIINMFCRDYFSNNNFKSSYEENNINNITETAKNLFDKFYDIEEDLLKKKKNFSLYFNQKTNDILKSNNNNLFNNFKSNFKEDHCNYLDTNKEKSCVEANYILQYIDYVKQYQESVQKASQKKALELANIGANKYIESETFTDIKNESNFAYLL